MKIMNKFIEGLLINKNKIIKIFAFIIIIIIIIAIIHKIREDKWNNIDVSNAIHGVIIEDNIGFYRKPKESKWRYIRDVNIGENAYIVENLTDEDGTEWYKVKISDKVGFVKKENIKYFEFDNLSKKVLMSDVSKFNLIYEHFNNTGEYEAFILKSGINYVYIRAGGRGYGEEGNFYTDPNFQVFIDACEYLGIPYGFYYIDEAITSEEIDEEVNFMKEFIQNNATELCKLPVVIDVENHDGVGRADELWEDRANLLTELIQKFDVEKINTIVYSNANIANQYLYEIDTNFWLAYYVKENNIPDNWINEANEDIEFNEDCIDKIIAWQFTDSGVGDKIPYKVDISLVENDFFKEFANK